MQLETDKECIARLMEDALRGHEVRSRTKGSVVVVCEKCGTELHIGDFPFCGGDPLKHIPAASGVIGDEFPGGVWIKHGICNPDGTPKKYYSKTEIKRALNEKGLNWADDTPKAYKIPWSGRRQDVKDQ